MCESNMGWEESKKGEEEGKKRVDMSERRDKLMCVTITLLCPNVYLARGSFTLKTNSKQSQFEVSNYF